MGGILNVTVSNGKLNPSAPHQCFVCPLSCSIPSLPLNDAGDVTHTHTCIMELIPFVLKTLESPGP